ncbi:Respiratory nitrate reductase delta chain (EC 1.7.99.4), partial [Pseudomonas sp. FEN]
CSRRVWTSVKVPTPVVSGRCCRLPVPSRSRRSPSCARKSPPNRGTTRWKRWTRSGRRRQWTFSRPNNRTVAVRCQALRARPGRKARCHCTGWIFSMKGWPPCRPGRWAMS